MTDNIDSNANISSGGSNPQRTQKENQSMYKNTTESQNKLKKVDSPEIPEDNFTKDTSYNLQGMNPVLAAKLANPKKFRPTINKEKKAPPQPSLKIKFASGGKAINPRKIKPQIPNRLQAFRDDRLGAFDKLADALYEGGAMHFGKKAHRDHKEYVPLYPSFSEQLGFEENTLIASKASLYEYLKEELKNIDSDLHEFMSPIIQELEKPNPNFVKAYMQLFLPLPIAFDFEEIDSEFEEDERETADGSALEEWLDKDESSERNENEGAEDEEEEDGAISLSIKTINFGKIHFLFTYDSKSNQVKINLNGNSLAAELAIPVESNIEDAIYDEVDDIDYLIRLWKNAVVNISLERKIKVKTRGRVGHILLKTCNSILKTIQESDIEIPSGEGDGGSYNII